MVKLLQLTNVLDWGLLSPLLRKYLKLAVLWLHILVMHALVRKCLLGLKMVVTH